MLSLLSLIVVASILTVEGYLFCSVLLQTRHDTILRWMMGYPLGALFNAIVFFVLHTVRIHFSALSVFSLHIAILLVLGLVLLRIRRTQILTLSLSVAAEKRVHPALLIVAGVMALLTVLCSALYALFIPSFYWDIFTNWAMQSHQFLGAGTFLTSGIAKPHYPILLHSLQMSVMLIPGWSDTLANTATLLLSLTSIGSLFLLLMRMVNRSCAILTTSVMLMIPLVSVHLQQGYADIHAATSLLLSVLLLEPALRSKDTRLMLLSGVFCIAAAWTKMEGFYLGILPWLGVVLWNMRTSFTWQSTMRVLVPFVVLAGLWPLHLVLNGLLLTPNGLTIGIHLADAPMVFRKLFVFGSYGLHWYAIVLILCVTFIKKLRSPLPMRRMILWGLCVTVFLMGIYLFTDDVIWLRQRTAFGRSMLFPTLLLTQALCLRLYAAWAGSNASSGEMH